MMIINNQSTFDSLKLAKYPAKDVVNDFLKTLRICKKGLRFKKKILFEFMKYIEETEELPANSEWDFRQAEKIFINGVFFGRCPITSAPFFNYLTLKEKNLTQKNKRTRDRAYNEVLIVLRQIGKFLADENILFENPAIDLKPKVIGHRDMSLEHLSLSEAVELLTAAYYYNEHRIRNFTLVLMLLSTAVRVGEVNELKISDFFIEKGVIYCEGKSGQRIRFSTPGLALTIKKLIEAPERINALEGQNRQYLFYSEKGGPITTEETDKILKELSLKAGITRDITAYWLRRTFATILAEAGLSTRTIQVIFDHDVLRSTEKYVAEYIRNDLRTLVDNSTVHNKFINASRKFTLVNSSNKI